MAEHSRYNISNKQAGLEDGILKNKLGIKNQKRLNNLETILIKDSYSHFFELLEQGKIYFDLKLLFYIHKYFLQTLYSWAGEIRNVDISKSETFFAPAKYIPQLLQEFEEILRENIPSNKESKREIAKKLAVIHNELNVIHPFREGNGRTIRLYLDLLAVHCSYETINYSKSSKQSYIEACKQGMLKEHKKMENIIFKGLTKNNSSD